jgi:hypothetical protein
MRMQAVSGRPDSHIWRPEVELCLSVKFRFCRILLKNSPVEEVASC